MQANARQAPGQRTCLRLGAAPRRRRRLLAAACLYAITCRLDIASHLGAFTVAPLSSAPAWMCSAAAALRHLHSGGDVGLVPGLNVACRLRCRAALRRLRGNGVGSVPGLNMKRRPRRRVALRRLRLPTPSPCRWWTVILDECRRRLGANDEEDEDDGGVVAGVVRVCRHDEEDEGEVITGMVQTRGLDEEDRDASEVATRGVAVPPAAGPR